MVAIFPTIWPYSPESRNQLAEGCRLSRPANENCPRGRAFLAGPAQESGPLLHESVSLLEQMTPANIHLSRLPRMRLVIAGFATVDRSAEELAG